MMAEVFPGPVVNLGVDILVGAAEVQDVVVILFFFNLPLLESYHGRKSYVLS